MSPSWKARALLPLATLALLVGCRRHFYPAAPPAAAGATTAPTATAPTAAGPAAAAPGASAPTTIVVNAAEVPRPEAGMISQRDPLVARHTATRIMRIAPGAPLPQHHHAGYDETFIVHEGVLTLRLDGVVHRVRRGDVLLIPAGTTIDGENGPEESVVVVVWANTGSGTALTTPGPKVPKPR